MNKPVDFTDDTICLSGSEGPKLISLGLYQRSVRCVELKEKLHYHDWCAGNDVERNSWSLF
jgi:hypothetical protein